MVCGRVLTVKEFIENGEEILKEFDTYIPEDEIYEIVVNRIREKNLPHDSKLAILQCIGYRYLETADEFCGLHVKVCTDEAGQTLYFPTEGISDVIASDVLFEESSETPDNTYYKDTIMILSEFDDPFYLSADKIEKANKERIKEFERDLEDLINNDLVYIEYTYDTEGNVSPLAILIFRDAKVFEKYITLNHLMNWKNASERTKILALSMQIIYYP